MRFTLTHQNLLFCRVPIDPILGFLIRTYKKVGFGRLRYKSLKYLLTQSPGPRFRFSVVPLEEGKGFRMPSGGLGFKRPFFWDDGGGSRFGFRFRKAVRRGCTIEDMFEVS